MLSGMDEREGNISGEGGGVDVRWCGWEREILVVREYMVIDVR